MSARSPSSSRLELGSSRITSFGLPVKSPGQTDPLSLPTRQNDAIVTNACVVPLRKGKNQFVDAGFLGRV